MFLSVFHILLSRHTKKMYNLAFRNIIDICSKENKILPAKIVSSDFEEALHKSI